MQIKNEEIVTVISHSLKLPRENVTPDLKYHDLPAWDSLGHIYLITELERHFNIRIPMENIYTLQSVDTICNYILNKKTTETTAEEKVEIHRGLKGIYFDETRISCIDAENSRISYREYDLQYLVQHQSCEEVIYLMVHEQLPAANELTKFLQELFILRKETFCWFSQQQQSGKAATDQGLKIVQFLLHLQGGLPHSVPPHAVYGACLLLVCLLNGYEYNPGHELSIDQLLSKTFQLNHANTQLLKRGMIMLMEHGANAGAFSLRLTASTGNNFLLSLSASVITFMGNKHGGAIAEVNEFLQMLKRTSNREWLIQTCISNNINIPGFGHRLYKKEDPRVVCISALISLIESDQEAEDHLLLCGEVLQILDKFKPYGLIPNVDFFTSMLFTLLKIPSNTFLPLFIASRIPGLIAHYHEQQQNNILIRPNLKYNGKPIIPVQPHL